MHALLVLLAALQPGLPGHATQIASQGDGSTAVITETDPGTATIVPGERIHADVERSTEHRAEQLWVDRNHLNAISDETVICGSGSSILASWYLNNPRISRYVTYGSGVPQWTYLAPGAGAGNFDIASGSDPVWSATSIYLGTLAWLGSGSQPSFQLPPGSKQDITDDGTKLVYVNGSSQLTCVDTATQEVLWQVPLQVVGNGVYGVEISGSANRVLVSAYEQTSGAQVYSMADGSIVGAPVGNYGQTKAAISDDGNRIVIGNFNGQIRMFQWSGSAWTLSGSITTGDSWVTAVAISGDGHTVAGGTLGFSPYRGRVVAVDWPASGSPATLWQYHEYGDEVSSVAICTDGSVIVAGSWGTYQATSGDVFTAFDRTGSVIFNLEDDIDEPGSIMSVDISDDGSFATASGKAVHARAFGNGGEVYGIQIMDAQTHDVGMVSVLAPVENQQVGNVVTPQVRVGNFGTSTETFNVSAVIQTSGGTVVWSDNATVTSLAAGAETNVSFDNWTVPGFGAWTFRAVTTLGGDTYPQNDSIQVAVRAYHDAAAIAILCPYAENTVGMAMTPMVQVQNCGTYTESIQVQLVIDLGGTQVYSQTVGTASLAPGTLASVSLPAWTPSETGDYEASAEVTVTDDYVPGNDAQALPFEVGYEIIYDDGEWDSFYWVGSQDDDMFATRFTPTIAAPYTATQFRVYVNSTEPFSWAALCPDNGSGMPDIDNPIYYVENLSAASAPSWLVVPIDVQIDDPGDLWFVTHWPDAKALGVGTDTDLPKTNRSWWHNTAQGWVNFTAGDWSFRLTLMPLTGTEGPGMPAAFALGSVFPNPSGGIMSIPVEVPSADTPYRVSVFDLSGRCVAVLADGTSPEGSRSLTWDCMSGDGSRAPSGVYFVRLEAPGVVESTKVVLIR